MIVDIHYSKSKLTFSVPSFFALPCADKIFSTFILVRLLCTFIFAVLLELTERKQSISQPPAIQDNYAKQPEYVVTQLPQLKHCGSFPTLWKQ